MIKLDRQETGLVGMWITEKKQVRADATCERIEWLASHHLKKIATSSQFGGWETLFQDPDDGRYWERTYPQGNMHGGGPPALNCLSKEQAKAKYGDVVSN
jgi:Immunity protein 27